MTALPWIAISVVAAVAVFGLIVAWMKHNKGVASEPDYRVFFILGICWLPLGVSTENYAFTVLGFVFMAIALANRDKWKEDSTLTTNKRRALFGVIVLVGLLTLLTLAITLYGRSL